jgi:hypothetical protein
LKVIEKTNLLLAYNSKISRRNVWWKLPVNYFRRNHMRAKQRRLQIDCEAAADQLQAQNDKLKEKAELIEKLEPLHGQLFAEFMPLMKI